MGLFNRNQQAPAPVEQPMTIEERAEVLREYAIEYITSLSKADKEKFTEAVDLIWQGRNILSRVKTADEKAYEKEAKASGMTTDEADDLGFDLLEDDPKPNPLITDEKPARKVEVKS
jgi:hypothetical protein